MTKETEENIGAVTDSVSQAIVTSNVPEVTNASLVIEEENKGTEKDALTQLFEDLENNEVANAIDAIFSNPYEDPRGEVSTITPMLKLSYSICPSTPTEAMQKEALECLCNNLEDDAENPYRYPLKNSFELKQIILGKDIVTFIGNIQKNHEPLVEIQDLMKKEWEKASSMAGAQSKSESKGMEIILN